MTEEEWAEKMTLCKNFAVEEMKKTSAVEEIKKTSQSEKKNTAAGLLFLDATISFRISVFDETRILLGNISIIFFTFSKN